MNTIPKQESLLHSVEYVILVFLSCEPPLLFKIGLEKMSLPNLSCDSEHSISQYISGLRRGNLEATQKIWERFIHRLIKLANRKLDVANRRSMDEEDVVQVAFTEFFAQVQTGRFPKLNDRNDLWQVLAMLVDRRAKDQIRRQKSLRAGGGQVVNASAVQPSGEGSFRNVDFMASVPSRTPTSQEAIEFIDALRDRLALLKNEEQQKVALLKLQGYSNREIADQISSSLRTVERTLNKIRSVWELDHTVA